MPTRPRPLPRWYFGGVFASKPMPLSPIVSRTPRASWRNSIVTWVASACRATLVSASCTARKSTVSCFVGRRLGRRSAFRVTVNSGWRPLYWPMYQRSAGSKPRSSNCAGRRSAMSRRSSVMALSETSRNRAPTAAPGSHQTAGRFPPRRDPWPARSVFGRSRRATRGRCVPAPAPVCRPVAGQVLRAASPAPAKRRRGAAFSSAVAICPAKASSRRSSGSPNGSSSRTDESARPPKTCPLVRSGAPNVRYVSIRQGILVQHRTAPSRPAPVGPTSATASAAAAVSGGGLFGIGACSRRYSPASSKPPSRALQENDAATGPLEAVDDLIKRIVQQATAIHRRSQDP